MQSIYKFINSCTLCLTLCLIGTTINAQDKNKDSIEVKHSRWSGVTLQVDVASIVGSALSNGETYSLEGAAQLNIKNSYYPIVEMGIAGANKTTTEDINFKTNGLFGRVGVDINMRKKRPTSKKSNNIVSTGVRLGMTNFAYTINNVLITDDYWGNKQLLTFNDQQASKIWYELVVGIKVEVFKNAYMGWTVRNKHLISKDKAGEVSPWYVPGYGINKASLWGINYIVGYSF